MSTARNRSTGLTGPSQAALASVLAPTCHSRLMRVRRGSTRPAPVQTLHYLLGWPMASPSAYPHTWEKGDRRWRSKGSRGQVLEPGDEGYETARQIWNGDIQRQPAVIARCTGAAPTCWPPCALLAIGVCRWRCEAAVMPSPGMRCARWPGHRPVADDRRAGRPLGGNGPAQGGCLWRHVDHESAGPRAGGHWRHRHPHRHRRVDPGRRDRPPHAPLRAHYRQPRRLRRGHRRW